MRVASRADGCQLIWSGNYYSMTMISFGAASGRHLQWLCSSLPDADHSNTSQAKPTVPLWHNGAGSMFLGMPVLEWAEHFSRCLFIHHMLHPSCIGGAAGSSSSLCLVRDNVAEAAGDSYLEGGLKLPRISSRII